MGHGSSVQTKSEEQNDVHPVQPMKFGEFKELYSIIRLINFNHFKTLKAMPRYPDNADVTITLDQLSEEEYNKSLIVFVSHCWLRGWSGAKGWDGRPHPDDAEGSKYDLCVRGIECIMKGLAPGMEECYIWLDFGCIDQDGSPAGELKLLDKIIQVSDCIVTPIVDENHSKWDYNDDKSFNHFRSYQSPNWIGKKFSYLNRGWCRVEMFFAANIPVLEDSEERRSKMKAALKFQRSEGRRPHILYGTKEKAKDIPVVLPPLQNSYFFEFHPEKGHLSKRQDRAVIKQLVKDLGTYMNAKKIESYVGPYASTFFSKKKEGKGVRVYANGDRYEGEFKNDLRDGYGKYIGANGDIYEGEYRYGQKHGKGVFRESVGHVYEGEYCNGLREGYGIYTYLDGGRYEGNYHESRRHGKGIYIYPNGDDLERYEGEWFSGVKSGRGIMKYSNGDIYEGEYCLNVRSGSGTLKKANGDVYRGMFAHDQLTGSGVYSYANGDVYEGEMKEGKKHGRGKLTKAIDGEVVEGEWRDDAVV